MNLFVPALFSLLFIPGAASAQQTSDPLICRASELMQAAYDHQPEIRLERASYELFTRQFLEDLALRQAKTSAVDTYRIPVVFHVYGTTQGGKTVSDTLIQSAMQALNMDFNGLNADFGQVPGQFMPLRGTLNVQFKLARKDPNGQPTTGIEYFPVKTGYASFGTHEAQIAADAWDNYRYINVYVMHDICGNGSTNNSAIATFPSVANNNAKVSRIVYNGALLGSNNFSTIPEFASVLTHEFGHYLNLIHTFEGGCTTPNDNVTDTPPCTTAQGCHTSPGSTLPLNCDGNLVNSDNYMDYNICYKMFTKGQRDRMEAALYLDSHISLWQDSNLEFTGITTITTVAPTVFTQAARVHPNPSDGHFYIDLPQEGVYSVSVSDAMGRIVYSATRQMPGDRVTIVLNDRPAGIYFLRLHSRQDTQQLRLQRL